MLPLDKISALEPKKLYCFVSGPGEGEAIALHIPDFGWVLVDSYLEGNQPASLAWVNRFPDAIKLLIWTHPHRDHCQGMDLLIDQRAPERILVPGYRLPGFREFLNLTRQRKKQGPSTKEYLLCQDALLAYERVNASESDRVLDPEVGTVLQFPGGRVELCHPDAQGRNQLGGLLQGAFSNFFNQFSAVARISWHDNQLLLGADLETAGWGRILAQSPDLIDVLSLKVPHHGSKDSLAGWCVASNSNASRTWWVTPKNTSHLPQLTELTGLQAAQPELSLTALPGYLSGPENGGVVCLSALAPAPPKLGGIRRKRGSPPSAPSACWVAQYNPKGLEETYFGPSSYLIRQENSEEAPKVQRQIATDRTGGQIGSQKT